MLTACGFTGLTIVDPVIPLVMYPLLVLQTRVEAQLLGYRVDYRDQTQRICWRMYPMVSLAEARGDRTAVVQRQASNQGTRGSELTGALNLSQLFPRLKAICGLAKAGGLQSKLYENERAGRRTGRQQAGIRKPLQSQYLVYVRTFE